MKYLTWLLQNGGHLKIFEKRREDKMEKGGHVIRKEDVW
jgi:hypothetical protein